MAKKSGSVCSTSTLPEKACPIVALGASAGGLEAFKAFFAAMPPASGMAFVVVAHLDPNHASLLPELVQKRTQMKVVQIQDGMTAERNRVHVIPPNKNLTISDGVFHLLDLPKVRSLNLPIDLFFRALAKDQGANAVCIVLSGTGSDGTLGLKAIKGEMGMVMVQDEASAKFDGMPGSAIATGLADYVMPPGQMPAQLIKYATYAAHQTVPLVDLGRGGISNELQQIYALLRTQADHDFSQYKKNTICRRIERRMNVHQIDDLADYVRYLQTSTREVDILFKELLIGVTSFFRDAAAFDLLRDSVLPKLLSEKPEGYAIRAWVAGCSSGEEAYSLAIILQECMERLHCHFSVQIFGTDIDEAAIAVARTGVYGQSILADVSPERLQRYFIKEDDGRYRVKRAIRETLVFAVQNIIKDPPFTKLDIVLCRNLLIYLGPDLQNKLFPIFHYSLKPEGILFLGSSESLGKSGALFGVLDKKWKIFQRKTAAPGLFSMLGLPNLYPLLDPPGPAALKSTRHAEALSAMQLVETILQQSNTPPCAIIDDDCNVIYIHGRIGLFLEPAEGKMSANILEMARPELKASMAAAIRKVTQHKQAVSYRGLCLGLNAERKFVDLSVKPIGEQLALRGLMMVIFEEVAAPAKEIPHEVIMSSSKKRSAAELEQDLNHTKENLQMTIEELETANEELKSMNEELQSTNEELQSTNEEMETSKEELQSLNEEAATVNAELQSRIEDLSSANDDIKNLLDSTEIATVLLDVDLCIRRFTPRATDLIPLTSTDVGRSISHFSTQLVAVDLADYGRETLKSLAVQEVEVQSKGGAVYIMRVRPYRTVNNAIAGVVITFEQITARRHGEERQHERESFGLTLMMVARDGILVLNDQGAVVDVNPAYCRMSGYAREELLCMSISDVDAADGENVNRLLANESDPFVTSHRRKDGALMDVEVSSACCDGAQRKIIVSVRDVPDRQSEKGEAHDAG